MAPGQRQDLTRVALQQAQKSAEALFETKSIADIKKVRILAPDHALTFILRVYSCAHSIDWGCQALARHTNME
jgi:hypothetical protein